MFLPNLNEDPYLLKTTTKYNEYEAKKTEKHSYGKISKSLKIDNTHCKKSIEI